MILIYLSQPAGVESFLPIYYNRHKINTPFQVVTTIPVIHQILSEQYQIPHMFFNNIQSLFKYIANSYPKIVLTDASINPHLHQVIAFTKSQKILTISILDFFSNYRKKFVEIPDYIIVPNEFVYKEMINEGFDKNILLKLGNPFFEWIIKRRPVFRDEYRRWLKIDKRNVLFISQCFKEDGYERNQEDIFRDWLQEIDAEENNILIKPHPREDWTWMRKYPVQIVNLSSGDSIYNFINFCDLIIGVSSTVLYVCFLRKIPFRIIDQGLQIDFDNPDILPYTNSVNSIINFLKVLL